VQVLPEFLQVEAFAKFSNAIGKVNSSVAAIFFLEPSISCCNCLLVSAAVLVRLK
jgi:hypothetical protein